MDRDVGGIYNICFLIIKEWLLSFIKCTFYMETKLFCQYLFINSQFAQLWNMHFML